MKKILNILFEIGKVKITLFVGISSACGYILAAGRVSLEMLMPVLGTFILACGSAAFNQVQETKTDALMLRTKGRPIPSLRINRWEGFGIALALVMTGLAILSIFSNIEAVLLGLLALFWYNAFYTPLKRITSLAVVPGALVGAIPPAIGWVSGGGSMANPQIWVFGMFIFIWQIPHFWLILLVYAKDYKRAGFPILTDLFTDEQLRRVTYIWFVALAATCLMMPMFGILKNASFTVFLVAAGIWLLWRTRSLMIQYRQMPPNFWFAFHTLNIYVLTVVILLSIDKLI